MSKYAKTKDGKIVKINLEGNVFTSKYEIIKEADTIEDLCDGLIVEEKENPNNWFIMEIAELDIEDLKYTLNDWIYKCFIKTDKGLIYIAKLNNNGELELV